MFKRRTLEQRQAGATAAREKRKAIARRLGELTDEERTRLAEAGAGIQRYDGFAYSPRNTILIAMQLPGASYVGGFHQWIEAGRVVKKGEHGATILFPSAGKKDQGDATDNPEEAAIYFYSTTVFDISQTEPLPAKKDQRDVAAGTDLDHQECMAETAEYRETPELRMARTHGIG